MDWDRVCSFWDAFHLHPKRLFAMEAAWRAQIELECLQSCKLLEVLAVERLSRSRIEQTASHAIVRVLQRQEGFFRDDVKNFAIRELTFLSETRQRDLVLLEETAKFRNVRRLCRDWTTTVLVWEQSRVFFRREFAPISPENRGGRYICRYVRKSAS